MGVKAATRVEVEDADKGIVSLVFARYNEIDKDGDVQIPGTFEDGAKMPVSAYGHGSTLDGRVPVGVGQIKDTAREARATAQFFMDTQDGADTFRAIKALHTAGVNQQWSYGYDVLKHDFGVFQERHVRFLRKQRVKEISPVLEGAGTTGTLAVKSASGDDREGGRVTGYKGLIAPHETDVTDARWNPVEVTSELGGELGIERLRMLHAWQDPNADPSVKGAYHFMHHTAQGVANVRACLIGIAMLNGAKHAPSIEDTDARRSAYTHMAEHLRDAGRPVPALVEAGQPVKLADELMSALADFTAVRLRVAQVRDDRMIKRERLGGPVTEALTWLEEEMRDLRDAMSESGSDVSNEIALAVARARGYSRQRP